MMSMLPRSRTLPIPVPLSLRVRNLINTHRAPSAPSLPKGTFERRIRRTEALAPASAEIALDEAAGCRVDVAVGGGGDEGFEDAAELGTLVRVVAELGVGEEGVEDAEVGVLELCIVRSATISVRVERRRKGKKLRTHPF